MRDPFGKYKHIYKFATLSCPTCRSDLVAGPFDQEARRRQNVKYSAQPTLFHFWHISVNLHMFSWFLENTIYVWNIRPIWAQPILFHFWHMAGRFTHVFLVLEHTFNNPHSSLPTFVDSLFIHIFLVLCARKMLNETKETCIVQIWPSNHWMGFAWGQKWWK